MVARQIFHVVANTFGVVNPFVIEAKWVGSVSAGLGCEAAMNEIVEVILRRPITPCVANCGERQGGISSLIRACSTFG